MKGWLRDVEMEQCENRSHKGATSHAQREGGKSKGRQPKTGNSTHKWKLDVHRVVYGRVFFSFVNITLYPLARLVMQNIAHVQYMLCCSFKLREIRQTHN